MIAFVWPCHNRRKRVNNLWSFEWVPHKNRDVSSPSTGGRNEPFRSFFFLERKLKLSIGFLSKIAFEAKMAQVFSREILVVYLVSSKNLSLDWWWWKIWNPDFCPFFSRLKTSNHFFWKEAPYILGRWPLRMKGDPFSQPKCIPKNFRVRTQKTSVKDAFFSLKSFCFFPCTNHGAFFCVFYPDVFWVAWFPNLTWAHIFISGWQQNHQIEKHIYSPRTITWLAGKSPIFNGRFIFIYEHVGCVFRGWRFLNASFKISPLYLRKHDPIK